MTMTQSTNVSSSLSSSSIPLASLLVARFLRSNNYAATLDTFIREAGLPPDAGSTSTSTGQGGRGGTSEYDDWTLEGVIQEKKTFDQSLRFERYGGGDNDDDRRERWSVPAPSKPTLVDTPGSSNLLSVSVEPWQRQEEQDDGGSYLVATAADKSLNLFDVGRSNQVVASLSGLSDSPILSYVSIRGGRYQLATSMSGQLLLIKNAEVLDRRKDHSKYAVKVVAYEDEDENDRVWIVTAGWDAKVLIYRTALSSSSSSPTTIGQPVATIKLQTNPESILVVRNPDTRELMLLVSRRDSTYIYYYTLEPLRSSEENQQQQRECVLRGKQNLAPHSTAWVAFSPSCMVLSPHDPGLLAVALSTLPHMKVMIVRLLFPSSESVDNTVAPTATATTTAESAALSSSSSHETHLSQALAALALQNREDAAIVIQANTFAPQTAYSTPQVVWRPDGSGLWVNGDDGVIRGIETKTGKVVAMLKDGHEAGSKVRSIWAGWVSCTADSSSSSEGNEENKQKEEWVVSGGFDKRLVVWRI